MHMIQPRIYLASRSPRRRELLHQIGVHFDPLLFRGGAREDGEVVEDVLAGEAVEDYVRRLARAKAGHGVTIARKRSLPFHPVLSADTTLDVDGEIIGKPRDEADALAILQRLSGREHRVLTAIAIAGENESIEDALSIIFFRFRELIFY